MKDDFSYSSDALKGAGSISCEVGRWFDKGKSSKIRLARKH
jgi:hypothetical protein